MSVASSRNVRTLEHFIDGRFVPPSAASYIDDVAPATGQVIARVPRGSDADVGAAVEAARRACEGWRRTALAERADLCDAVADGIAARLDELAALLAQA